MNNLKLLVSLVCLTPLSLPAANFVIDYTYDSNNFFDTTTSDGLNARTVIEDIAFELSGLLADNLSAIQPSSPNTYEARFNNPGTGDATQVTDLAVASNDYIIYVGGRPMGGNVLGVGAAGGFSASGTADFFDTLYRDQPNAQGADATDFGRWGGALSFDNDGSTNWYFGLSEAGLQASQVDFYSVAYHEILHTIGIGGANSWMNQITDNNGDLLFTGDASTDLFGSNPPISSDRGHFAEGTQSRVYNDPDGTMQELLMDPSITFGERKDLTELDLAALQDIGWEINAIPEPSTLTFTSLTLLCLLRRKRS